MGLSDIRMCYGTVCQITVLSDIRVCYDTVCQITVQVTRLCYDTVCQLLFLVPYMGYNNVCQITAQSATKCLLKHVAAFLTSF